MSINPYSLTIDLKACIMKPFKKRTQVRLSSLRDYFMDRKAVDDMLSSGKDLIIYEYFEYSNPESEGHVNIGVTIINPGRIGKEYYMTRGHYHEKSAAEVYLGLSGEGIILMQLKDGEAQALKIMPGKIIYVPPHWGHRAINTGNEKMIFFYMYPSNAGHNYQLVKEKGFSKIVIEENGLPKIIDNPRYKSRN